MSGLKSRRPRRASPAVRNAARRIYDRASAVTRANIDRRLLDHALTLKSVFFALEGLGQCAETERRHWAGVLLWAVRRANQYFENSANDVATLAAAYELAGMVTSALALRAAIGGTDWNLADPFECSVPAEDDPVAGPEIRERAAAWDAAPQVSDAPAK
jgi:hypothetical protein